MRLSEGCRASCAISSGEPKSSCQTHGPHFKFNEAVSFQVYCDTQEELDYFRDKLSEGGDERAQQRGWLKDKYGLSWQIEPADLGELLGDHKSEKSQRAFKAMLQMKKLDIAKIRQAYNG